MKRKSLITVFIIIAALVLMPAVNITNAILRPDEVYVYIGKQLVTLMVVWYCITLAGFTMLRCIATGLYELCYK